MTRTSARRTRTLASLAAATLLALTLAACSGNDDSAGDSDAPMSEVDTAMGAPADGGATGSDSGRNGLSSYAADEAAALDAPATERSLISQGNVQLRSDDVGEARFEVQKVVDQYAGEITQEETSTDDEGEVKRSRMVLRIPAADFAEAMTALEESAELISSSSSVDDVTTQVIDTEVRVEAQRRSIERITLLLDRAQSIRDIVSIEAQLTQRQADLASLEQQRAYLADQTSQSTITVSLQRTKAAEEPEEDASGFLAGLEDGWDAFKDAAVGIATVAGALLPFVVVVGLLGILAWPLVRRSRRRKPAAVSAGPVTGPPTGSPTAP